MKSRYKKLLPGDEIRIVAPSQSWSKRREAVYERAIARLQGRGYMVTKADNVASVHRFGTASVDARITDLEQAYRDERVCAILCLNGGWSANELLERLDWSVIKSNPKPLIGFSDITVLLNAIYAKTGQIGLLGPNLGSLGRKDNWEYSLDSMNDVLTATAPLLLRKSTGWASDPKRFKTTRSWKTLQTGVAQGVVIGGNIGTYYLLQGTEYAPRFEGDVILVIEDDDEAGKWTAREFDRRLESLMNQPGAKQTVRGVLIGRFQPQSSVTMNDIRDIVSRKFSKDIPIIADIDFGHTKPLLTLPIGGVMMIDAQRNRRPNIRLQRY